VTGERLPATHSLSIGLVGVLQRLAQERGVPVDALVEHLLFKQLRGERARRLVGEQPEPIPASFLNDRVAAAKVELAKDVAAIHQTEGRGDKAARAAAELEALLADASGHDEHLEAVQRTTAERDARVDLAMDKTKPT
jgi:hypothetical protein